MPRRLIRTDLNHCGDNDLCNISGISYLGKQPVTIDENSLTPKRKSLRYNGSRKDNNIPSDFSANHSQQNNVTSANTLRVSSFNETTPVLEVHAHKTSSSVPSEEHDIHQHAHQKKRKGSLLFESI